MKLLIADDDLTSRVLLQNLSRKWGFDPIVVEDGEAAWLLLQSDDAPRLLLMDWEMPKLTGLALCQRIRRKVDSNPVYIILLTSRNKTIDIVTGLEAGANDYVTKPFNNVELQARVQVGRRVFKWEGACSSGKAHVQVGRRMLALQQELNEAKEMLAFQANHDVLTELFNRRAIEEGLQKEISRAMRESKILCVAMCDIDFFKKVNDGYGHPMGDHVIREVSRRISSILRPYDLAGRYGGEEFLLIFNAAKEDACSLLERIRLAIADVAFNFQENSIRVTISCGLTFFDPTRDEPNSEGLIDCADKALYQAKQTGRNKVVIA